MLVGWLMLQSLQATPPIAFDLAKVTPAEAQCGESVTGEIVVCAKNRRADRLTVLAPVKIDPMLPNAEMRVGQATLGLVGSQRVVGGVPSNSIMATIRVPF